MEEAAALAGVAAPRFHEVDWVAGQTFTAEDDPDRTSDAWVPPAFVVEKDPVAQRERTSVEDIEVPSGASWGHVHCPSFARMVHHVLEPAECEALIECVNAKGFTPALLNVGGGNQLLAPDTRDGHRVIVDSGALAGYLLEVIRPHLPTSEETLIALPLKLEELNERCRFLCYTPGQVFEPHCDGIYTRPRGHPKVGDQSQVTLQLYLHDVPPEHGGATTIIGNVDRYPCQPRCGSVLIFSQDLYHEGSRLTHGLKYTMRTEAMYQSNTRDSP